jgi:hypothetical protein
MSQKENLRVIFAHFTSCQEYESDEWHQRDVQICWLKMSTVIIFFSWSTDIVAISLRLPSIVTFDSEGEENYAKLMQNISVCYVEVIFKVV